MKFVELEKYEIQNLIQIKEMEKLQWFIELKTLKEGDAFGSCAPDPINPNSTVNIQRLECTKPTQFITLNQTLFKEFSKKQAYKDQMYKCEFLSQLPFLKHWTSTQLKKMIELFKFETFKRNQVVYCQGDQSDKIYIIDTGNFEVVRKRRTRQK